MASKACKQIVLLREWIPKVFRSLISMIPQTKLSLAKDFLGMRMSLPFSHWPTRILTFNTHNGISNSCFRQENETQHLIQKA